MSAYDDTMKRAWSALERGEALARVFALIWDEARGEERRDAMKMERAQREAAKLRARSPGDHTGAPPCDSCGNTSPDGLHSASGIRLCSTCSPPRSP